jgi:uncharacterized repeat protein (TIGR01451 family)
MKQHKLIVSIALGSLITLGLLLGLNLTGKSVMASTARVPQEVLDQPSAVSAIRAQEAVSTAHVVVVFSGEKATVRPITWTGTISRVTALELAGFNVGTSGGFICNIEGDGCPVTNCWCPDNWWWQGNWDAERETWNAPWPLPNPTDGDVLGFRNNTSWGPPVFPAQSYLGSLKALNWLRDQQQTDGGFGSAGSTAEVLMAIGANRIDATTWRRSTSVLANMLANGVSLASDGYDPAAGAGKLAVALAANGGCWPVGAQRPMDHYSPVTGKFSINLGSHAWAMIGTAALDQTVPASATAHLESVQLPSGGWEWSAGWGADTNSTALAIQALVAAGEPVTSTTIVGALNYLEGAQNDDGGFPYDPASPWGTDSDTNSTAYVIQALLATGQDPLTGTWTVTSSNPISFLVSMQLPDGSFEWQKGLGGSQFATQQTIPALLGRPLPVRVAAIDPCYGIAGRVMEAHAAGGDMSGLSNGDPLADVTIWAQGADDLYFGTTISPTGDYTISVPAAGGYDLTPAKVGYVFSPTVQQVTVSGSPGDVTLVDSFVGGNADVSIVKDGRPGTVTPGSLEYLTYTLTVHNAGPFDAENVRVTDTLPAEVFSPPTGTLVLPNPPGTVYVPGTARLPGKVWWDLGTLAAGATEVLMVGVEVQDWVTQTFTNTVVVTTTTYDPHSWNNTYEEPTIVAHSVYLPFVLKSF